MKLRNLIRSSRGFTTPELLVTLAIAGILMGIAVPSFISWLPTKQLSDATRQVATDLQLARTKAISKNTAITVTFTVANSTYSFDTETRDLDNLYPGVTISNDPPLVNPTFTAHGTANATTITLINGTGTLEQDVTLSTVGRVGISQKREH